MDLLLKVFLALIIHKVATVDISSNVFGNDRNALPAAFGDFNSDELTDVFVTRNGGQVLEILLANEKEPLLRAGPGLRCEFINFKVTSVVPGDFDGDAFMDILITTQANSSNTSTLYHDVRIIWGGVNQLNCTEDNLEIVTTTKGHPLAMDYNQDMIIDLFGVNIDNRRTFWVFNHTRSAPREVPLRAISNHEVSVPHSHSFLDINGDYTSDLLLTTPIAFEIWLGSVFNQGFHYLKSIELPTGSLSGHIGQSIFLDVELTGKLYLLLPFCYDKECTNSTILLNDDGVWVTLFIDFEDDLHNNWGFFPPIDEIYKDTITMRGGDYNMDGYPDLLVSLRQGKETELQPFLLENIPCVSLACTFKRSYKVQWNALGSFRKGTILSVFYDFYQDGILDFILLQRNKTTKQYSIGAFKNNLDYDANFIKVMVLTGLTNKIVPVTVGALGKKKGTYGTNLPGPRILYHTLSQEGLPRAGVCAQLPQSAYYALNLPYSIFGLDRTPNFVDTLMVGLSNRSKTWTQLIPNSQMVVIPWPPDDPSRWKAQLFVTPNKLILKSAGVFTGICALLALAVIILHYREKVEDRIEAQAAQCDREVVHEIMS